MKSFGLLFLILFVGCIYGQSTQIASLYAQFTSLRSKYCLPAFTTPSALATAAQTAANNGCKTGSVSGGSYSYLYYNFASSSFSYDSFYSFVLGKFQSAVSSWTCLNDVSNGDATFARLVVAGGSNQQIACAFSDSSCTSSTHYIVCLFGTGINQYPILSSSSCNCKSTTTTTTGSASSSSSSSSTTTTTTGSATTTTTTTGKSPSTTTTTTTTGKTTTTTTGSTPSTTTTTTTGKTTTTTGSTPTTTTTGSTPSTTTTGKSPTTTTTGSTPSTTTGSTPSTTTGSTPTTSPSTPTPSATQAAWLKRINAARECLGVTDLKWNATLANDAQAWVNVCATTCSSVHSYSTTTPPRNEADEGENIWAFQGSTLDALTAIDLGTQFWVDEAIGWGCSGNTCSSTTTPQSVTLTNGFTITLSSCDHYTQIIWRQSTSIGCAWALCPSNIAANKYLGVCRFNPPGNWNNLHPLYPNVVCNAPGCSTVARSSSGTIEKSPSTTQSGNSTPFFANGSQIAVFSLAIIIAVVVVSIFVILLVSYIRRNKRQDDYQLLENK